MYYKVNKFNFYFKNNTAVKSLYIFYRKKTLNVDKILFTVNEVSHLLMRFNKR